MACSPERERIAPGSDADIVIFDPKEKHDYSATTHHMNVDYSGYEGWHIDWESKNSRVTRSKVAIDNERCLLRKAMEIY